MLVWSLVLCFTAAPLQLANDLLEQYERSFGKEETCSVLRQVTVDRTRYTRDPNVLHRVRSHLLERLGNAAKP
jgi:chemotaxis methyl-accepting protein methylase